MVANFSNNWGFHLLMTELPQVPVQRIQIYFCKSWLKPEIFWGSNYENKILKFEFIYLIYTYEYIKYMGLYFAN